MRTIVGVTRLHSMPVDVHPRDADRLRAVCRQWFERVTPAPSGRIAVSALANVRDPVAVDCLRQVIARNLFVSVAIQGLARIPGAEATEALTTLTSSENREIAALATGALRARK